MARGWRRALRVAVVASSLGLLLGPLAPRAARPARHLCAVAAPQSPLIAGLARRVRACNDVAQDATEGRPLLVGGRPLGVVLPRGAAELSRFPDVFRVSEAAVELVAGGDSAEARTDAVRRVLEQLRGEDRVPMLRGWRDEGWPVKSTFDSPAELVIERAAGPLLGVRGFGCHVNGLVLGAGAAPRIWVARRAATKQTYPGKLDHVVAGGLAHGESPSENVLKECGEEAGVPADLARAARPAGVVSYCQKDETGWGVKRDQIFCYDLELPPDFVPTAQDGEVESFELWELQRLLDDLAADNDDWKPNVALVIIDMLVRRGFLAPEEPGYVDLAYSLKS